MKLMVFIRFYTIFNFIAIFLFSLCIYFAYIWITNILSFSHTIYTINILHQSPLFYLTVFFCVGTTFAFDLFFTGLKFNLYTSPTDFLRKIVSRKLNLEDYKEEFDKLFKELKTEFVTNDLNREQDLERRRELLAQEVNKKMTTLKVKPE